MPRRSCLAVGGFGGAHVVGPRGTLGAKKIYLGTERGKQGNGGPRLRWPRQENHLFSSFYYYYSFKCFSY